MSREMERSGVERILTATEDALARGGRVDLRALGFWRAVEAVKRHSEWIDAYAERLAAADREAFRRSVRVLLPVPVGVFLLAVGTVVGAALLGAGAALAAPWNGLLVLAAAAVLIGVTHDLAHLAVGSAAGIRFTDVFIVGPLRPQIGLKIDYASYLKTPPRERAWMHASGAIVTKVIPFFVLAVTASVIPLWASLLLVLLGVAQLVTDALLSTRHSDWKRFRREMRLARPV